ncbi:MAG: hypothetical protein D6813_04110 [Calditrichaeota bacterium]|nr:MAG: hypothetical protein D6813_04110 [Calditrichota bacterium]
MKALKNSIKILYVGVLFLFIYLNTSCDQLLESLNQMGPAFNIEPDSIEVEIGKTFQLRATILVSADFADTTLTIVWKSLNENIASVSEEGVVTGKNVGETRIVAAFSEMSDTTYVRVVAGQEAIITSVEPDTIPIGQRIQVIIKGFNLQGTSEVKLNRSANIENPPQVNADGTEVSVFLTVTSGEAPGPATLTLLTPKGNPEVTVFLQGVATITSISPPTLVLGERTEVTITGTNLHGATRVSLDRPNAVIENPPSVNNDGTEVKVFITVPESETPGSATLTVFTPQGNPSKSIELVQVQLGTGDLQVTLTWDTDGTDVDLHVIEPDGTHVFFSNLNGTTAKLDVDDTDGFGPENIFVEAGNAASGTYEIFIVYYSGDVETNATITIKLFKDTNREQTFNFTRTLQNANTDLGINVANVTFPDGTVQETTGTRDISNLNPREVPASKLYFKKIR